MSDKNNLHSIASSLETNVGDLDAITTILWDMIAEADVKHGPLVFDTDRHGAANWLIGQLIVTQRELQKQVDAAYSLNTAMRAKAV